MNLKDVKQRVRSILGDPDGDWTIDSYLVPMVNHVYSLQELYLRDAGAPNLTTLRVVPNIPAGKSNLSEYQVDANKPLYGLLQPWKLGVNWKQAGAPDNFYRLMTEVDILPDWTPASGYPPYQAACFEWREFKLWITPFTYPIDLRVRGDYRPPPLLKDTDEVLIHPDLGVALVEETATCVMRERANPGQMSAYQIVGRNALDRISNLLVRQTQGRHVRVGRMNGARGARGGNGNANGG